MGGRKLMEGGTLKKWEEILHKKHVFLVSNWPVPSAHFLFMAITGWEGNSPLRKAQYLPKSQWRILFQNQQGKAVFHGVFLFKRRQSEF